jgi:plasmid stabilization system protein ParE
VALIVEWEAGAEEQLDRVLHFYLTQFGEGSAGRLYRAISDRLNDQCRYPESGIRVGRDEFFRYVQVLKSYFVYYTFAIRNLP